MGFKWQPGKCCGCGQSEIDFSNPPKCNSECENAGVAVPFPETPQDYVNIGMPCYVTFVERNANDNDCTFYDWKDIFSDHEIKYNVLLPRLMFKSKNKGFTLRNSTATIYKARYFMTDCYYTDYYNEPLFSINPIYFFKFIKFEYLSNESIYLTRGVLIKNVDHTTPNSTMRKNETLSFDRYINLTKNKKHGNIDDSVSSVWPCLLPRVYNYQHIGDKRNVPIIKYNPYLEPKRCNVIDSVSVANKYFNKLSCTWKCSDFELVERKININDYEPMYYLKCKTIIDINEIPSFELKWYSDKEIDFETKIGVSIYLPDMSYTKYPTISFATHISMMNYKLQEKILTGTASFSISVLAYVYTYSKQTGDYIESKVIEVAKIFFTNVPCNDCKINDRIEAYTHYKYDDDDNGSWSKPLVYVDSFNAVQDMQYDFKKKELSLTMTSQDYDLDLDYGIEPKKTFEKRTTFPLYFDTCRYFKINSLSCSATNVLFYNPSLRENFESILLNTSVSLDDSYEPDENDPLYDGPHDEFECDNFTTKKFKKGMSVVVNGDKEEHQFVMLDKYNQFIFHKEQTPPEETQGNQTAQSDSQNPTQQTEEQTNNDTTSNQSNQNENSSNNANTTNNNNNEGNDENESSPDDELDTHPPYFRFAYGHRIMLNPNQDEWREDAEGNWYNLYIYENAKPDSEFGRIVNVEFNFETTLDETTENFDKDAIAKMVLNKYKERGTDMQQADCLITPPGIRAIFPICYFDPVMKRTNGNETYEIPLQLDF